MHKCLSLAIGLATVMAIASLEPASADPWFQQVALPTDDTHPEPPLFSSVISPAPGIYAPAQEWEIEIGDDLSEPATPGTLLDGK
jgi:hypothetical protein